MVRFTAAILQFGAQGEKSGWCYIAIPIDLTERLSPGNKKSFRVKGRLDDHAINGIALLPMGGGQFIMPLNAAVRKAIHKQRGAMVSVQLEPDLKKPLVNKMLLACLKDVPAAYERFTEMPPSHQLYYSKWIESAKTEPTRTKRIALAVRALENGMTYAEMLRMSGQL